MDSESSVPQSGFTEMAHHPEKGDGVLSVRFYYRSVFNKLKSDGGFVEKIVKGLPVQEWVDGQGAPVHEDVEYVEIKVPGDKLEAIDRKATKHDKKRFARQYEQFKRGAEAKQAGTPLAAIGIGPGRASELEYQNVYTLEQLRDMSDGNASKAGVRHAERQKARDFLDAAKGAAPVLAMREALASRDNEIETLKNQMRMLLEAQSREDEVSPGEDVPAPKKRGRKPKAIETTP